MKIAVIGTGNVGATLGKRLSVLGHDVTYGTRDANSQKVRDLIAGTKASAKSAAEAIRVSDVILLAVPWESAKDMVDLVKDDAGKIIIDCTNPLLYNTGFRELSVGNTDSAAETIQRWAGSTPVIKAFNTTGSANMENPEIGGSKVTMYVAGDNVEAKTKVIAIVNQLGFESFDTGPLYTSRFLESIASLWVHTAYILGRGPGFAINIVQR